MHNVFHSDLAREFAAAQPFRYVVIDNFLDPAFCDRLLREFPAFDERKALNESGQVGRKAVVSELARIGSAYKAFDGMLREAAFLREIGELTGLQDLLYDPDYVGGGTHENLDGQDLDVHVDFNYHPKRLWHRRLNLIVFLNPEWAESWGGNRELHRDPWSASGDNVVRIVPLANRAVIFETTETSWHGFSQIQLPAGKEHISRRSIAVYFYTKQRPAEQTGPAHGTIYVPRPLPEHLQAGYTLRPEDVDILHQLTTRRNDQLRFLYERELEFSTVLSGITRSPSFRIGRALTWPLRKLLAAR